MSSLGGFAALKQDGSVVNWGGDPIYGYGSDSSNVASELKSGVVDIFSTAGAFAALKDDGSVVAWSNENYGVILPLSHLSFNLVSFRYLLPIVLCST